MSGKHRPPHSVDHRKTTNWPVMIGGSLSFAVATAGVLAGVFVQFSSPGASDAPAASVPAGSTPVTQHGTVVAVTPDSVTTRSDNGVIQTYRITADTTAVTVDRQNPASPAASFTVDDRVSVFATVHGGQQIATAVADREAVGPNGPPMDYLAAP